MEKLYDLIIWHNNTTPALNEDNLNAMSEAIDNIDDRVVSLGGAVLEVIPDLEDMLSNAQQLQQYRDDAVAAATSAEDDEEDAEAYAIGTRGGVPVTSGDPAYHNNSKWYSEQANPTAIANLTDVDITGITNGQILKWNSTTQKFENANGGGAVTVDASDVTYDNTASGLTATNAQGAIDEVEGRVDTAETSITNKHKTTAFTVSTTGWTTDTTSQSGTTLYKKSVSLNHVYVTTPEVSIGAASGSVLPTTAEQESYDLIQYATCDSAVPCIYLYASDVPTTAFYIKVTGVD